MRTEQSENTVRCMENVLGNLQCRFYLGRETVNIVKREKQLLESCEQTHKKIRNSGADK